MDLFHIVYKNIPVFLSMQVFITLFFLYRSLINLARSSIIIDLLPDSEDTITTIKQPEKYEDKYKNGYIKLESRKLTSIEKEKLKNNFIMETTPLGNVIMYYNIDKNGFVYYSDSTIPYRFLETVARKYITTFQCKDRSIYVDETDNDIDDEIDKKNPTVITPEIKSDTILDKKTTTNTTKNTNKKVFVKFKNYNHPNSIPSTSMIAKNNPNKTTTQSMKEVKENKNKYISEGKIINYSFIKKIDKKQIVKRLNMTFAEFKKMQQESKNKTSL
jgi:hypothetical protein